MIKNHKNKWVQGDDKIAKAAVHHFKNLFNTSHTFNDFDILNYINPCIADDDNIKLVAVPDLEEIKDAVFNMSASSAPGPDGYSGIFFHKCWDMIQYDIMEYVQDFFRGKNLSKFYSHTCLILIPKTDSPFNFSELRPISLSNFTCKIISKILSNRLNPLLERLISENQSGFIKGRLIHENVLLTQEIAHGIKQYNKGGNVIMKLDMAKAYDKMSWYFLMSVMKQFGFSGIWLDMIWRIIANVWYSILINGNRVGFFSSSHGLKQGDPLSPSLFIIGSELLSRMLNSLNSHEHFTPFSMNFNGPVINHLAYADDIVIFSGGNNKSIKLIKHQIRRYEKASGQQVNDAKSFFITAPKTDSIRINRLRRVTGYMDNTFPFTYLGCPIYNGKKNLSYFDGMLAKIVKRLNGWQCNMLSHGGKVILIKHVLQSVPIYTLSAITPPKK
ncbi:hypothetical protein MTR67_042735 [Solanum verrucosum]|uniref:Reverse transcriptase domain-containing protein n=1 Tax=Solanum verrucosum TaxID=315347 RepID=A0AAF0UP22_SOLVR|nr:hypothetical protein MTR67_042735 [Solanum verrucosum]